ncbi:MAG: 6-carboxytetrahydropterin synthase [Candidatus Thermoplasmatota archaeon]|jgi:6-pyruvoyltetrahydropterin/6-carboxytetrahydropterin synthase|nr:6-carboxytetrahydropterin synthase [Candidatus Thermoplasmatota archaeon]
MERRIEIDGWKSGIRFSSCHMLLRHDKCSRLHGHTYCIHLRITGSVNEDMMLFDFGRVKEVLRGLASVLDHRTIIPTGNEEIGVTSSEDGRNVVVDLGGRTYSIPKEDAILLPIRMSTAEELSRYLLERFIKETGPGVNISRIELGVDEGMGQGAWCSMDLTARGAG